MGVSAPVSHRAAHNKRASRVGDRVLLGLCALAGVIVAVTLIDIGYQLVNNAKPAIDRFGLGFLGHEAWAPNFKRFGAATCSTEPRSAPQWRW